MHVFRQVPTIPLGRILAGADHLASQAHPRFSNGNSAHVLVMLGTVFPKVAAGVTRTGVALRDVHVAADAEPPGRDYDFVVSDAGTVAPSAFLAAVLADPATTAGRLAAAWGWSRRDIADIADAAHGVVPTPLPGWIDGANLRE